MIALPTFTVGGKGQLSPAFSDPSEYDGDPRGIVWMWEPPKPQATYVMGVDPAAGRTGWARELRIDDDSRIDNGCIQVVRIGRGYGDLDVQVCEFAAPIDPEDLADVANLLGRIYAGNEEDGQCKAIVEVWPGPGLLTQRRMINYHGYTNHFRWQTLDSYTTRTTNYLGWTSSPKTARDLWLRGHRHISQNKIVLNSPWLIEEMADAAFDFQKMRGRAVYGKHDDRIQALLMAIWAGHEWSSEVETENVEVVDSNQPAVNWQATDITYEGMMLEWEEKFASMLED